MIILLVIKYNNLNLYENNLDDVICVLHPSVMFRTDGVLNHLAQ